MFSQFSSFTSYQNNNGDIQEKNFSYNSKNDGKVSRERYYKGVRNNNRKREELGKSTNGQDFKVRRYSTDNYNDNFKRENPTDFDRFYSKGELNLPNYQDTGSKLLRYRENLERSIIPKSDFNDHIFDSLNKSGFGLDDDIFNDDFFRE